MPSEDAELLRAAIFHTPGNPFRDESGLETFADGGLLIADGRIAALGSFNELRAAHPSVATRDLRPGFILPGFIDTHTHFPQLRIMGGLGYTLLDWLEQRALPEEARMADIQYAAAVAGEFVNSLIAHGATTALVFGSHFVPATAALFDAAAEAGLRIASGLVLSDQMLRPELHLSPDAAYRASQELILGYHGRSRISYAVTPRFALSCSEALLQVCQTLLDEHTGLLFQTHLNENQEEVRQVGAMFPWAANYLAVYDRFHLLRPPAVFAHNVHPAAAELSRLSATKCGVAYCPSSNAALGSGFFPMRRHLEASVRFGLGTDVGAGTGLGMLKEGLQAYLLQRLDPDGYPLTPAHLLYLSTRAGAELLGMENFTGDLSPGKSADFVYLRAPEGSALAGVLAKAQSEPEILGALFTMGSSDCVVDVRVAGKPLRKN